MDTILDIKHLTKTYAGGLTALDNVSLAVHRGEIFALLGPNGAGKTTLINIICGLVRASSGSISVDGFDAFAQYRDARARVALVPQEIALDPFISVVQTMRYARGFYGKRNNPALIEETLKALTLWDKRDKKVGTLSGGMKRRVLIAKALMNEPHILFLDEPTAGVDVELRKGMWDLVRTLKERGTTIILTTHYIEEAQLMADRVGIINHGAIALVDTTAHLMQQFGSKKLTITLATPPATLPDALGKAYSTLALEDDCLVYTYGDGTHTDVTQLLAAIAQHGLDIQDIATQESSLEEIFVDLINAQKHKP